MNLRGLAAAGTMCLAVVAITGCNDDKADVGKTANVKPTGPSGSASSTPAQVAGQPNGIDQLPPQQILEKAAQALETAPSWHVVTGNGKDKIEFSLDGKGDCRGKRTDEGEAMDFILQGDSLYARPLGTFWKNHFKDRASQARQFVAGRYIKTSSDDPEFTPLFCSRNMLRASIFSAESIKVAKLTKGAKTVVDGVGTLQLKGTLQGSTTTLVVATTGKPYPLQVETSDAGTPMRMNFSEFGKSVAGDVPAPADTIGVEEVKQKVGASE
ncbi:hypothetical protein ABT030_02980 [Streptomyces mirabilis]|uniref:hypothetical protein n=1 Tax=Streptomyces mirabilis TaxID=68239 RepID=UPI00331D9C3F